MKKIHNLSLFSCLLIFGVPLNLSADDLLPENPGNCSINCSEVQGQVLPESPAGITALPKEKIQQDFWGRDSTKSYYLEDANAQQGGINHQLNEIFYNLSPYHANVGTRVDRLGQAVDEWVGDSEFFQSQRSNRLDITFPISYRLDDGSFNFMPQFQAKLYFPNTNQRWSLMVETTKDSFGGLTDNKSSNVAATANNEDDKVNLTLQKLMVDNPYFTIRTDLGGTFKGIEPDPLAGFRLEYILPTSERHQNRLIQKAYWQRMVGKVFDTQYRHDLSLDTKHLVRADSRATWWYDEEYWSLSQSLGYYQTINQHRFFSYTLRSDWRTVPRENVRHESVGIGWGWRETLYQQWVFARLSPYLNYRHDADRKMYFFEPSITLALELSFYDVKKQ